MRSWEKSEVSREHKIDTTGQEWRVFFRDPHTDNQGNHAGGQRTKDKRSRPGTGLKSRFMGEIELLRERKHCNVGKRQEWRA